MMIEDWIVCNFEDVVKHSKGKKPKNLIKSKSEGSNAYINIKAFEKNIIEEYSNDISVNFCNTGDLLMVWDGARAGFTGKSLKGIVGSTLMKIEPINDKLVEKNFVFYFLKSLFKFLNTNTKGVGIPHVEPNYLWKKEFLLPPLPIQRTIVKKIERVFSSLDSGIADLKKAQEQLKVYQQAVLNKAFETEYPAVSLGNLIVRIEAGKSFRCKEVPPENNDVGVLKVSSISWGEFDEMESKTVVDYSRINESYFVKKNDFLLSRANTIDLVGNSVVVTKISKTLMLSDKTLRLVFNQDLDKYYLLYFLRTTKGRHQIMNLSTGNQESMRNISQSSIKEIQLPLPLINRQQKIVKDINSRLSVYDVLQQQLKGSLQKLETLRQGILKKAFTGELLTQTEITLCKQESDYEPASVLLEKIKAEKDKVEIKAKNVVAPQEVKPAIVSVPKVSADIHAGLIAKIIKLHETSPACKDNLTHIKCEKIAHLVEYHAQVPLGRLPVKDAAGPDDYPHLKKVESRAIKAGFFKIKKNNIGYTYLSGKQIDTVIRKFETSLSTDQSKKVNSLLQLFLQFDLEQAEIAATTYAGWNNLIILGNSNPSDEEIVTESRENWSARKMNIPRERFFNAIKWLRKKEVNLIPTGYGIVVVSPAKKKK